MLCFAISLVACGSPMEPGVECSEHITVPNVNMPTQVRHAAWTLEEGTVVSTCSVIMRGMGVESTAVHPETSSQSSEAGCVVTRNPTQNQENVGVWSFKMAPDWKSTKMTFSQGAPYTDLVWDIPCHPSEG
jgi:hypothetical protein